MALDSKILVVIPSDIKNMAYDDIALESAINATHLGNAPVALKAALSNVDYKALVVSLLRMFNASRTVKSSTDTEIYTRILVPRITEDMQILDKINDDIRSKLQQSGNVLGGLGAASNKFNVAIVGIITAAVLLFGYFIKSSLTKDAAGMEDWKRERLDDLERRRPGMLPRDYDAERTRILTEAKPDTTTFIDQLAKIAIFGGIAYFVLAVLPKIVSNWAGAAGAVKAVRGGESVPGRGARTALPAGYGYPAPQAYQQEPAQRRSGGNHGGPAAPAPAPRKRPKTPPSATATKGNRTGRAKVKF